ncbi:Cupin domain protein [Caulifigura coniformis]|uniref:Cupin domain protein n=1 Tax=Caulifigura coniformis TaxID=2527983 RepID=A0A517SHX7_9PLAN|nr:cupin domain-containing protein [Caulifigura coniformis]QDT55728.1 Cupin domain protein [Caulifigura coniformis]
MIRTALLLLTGALVGAGGASLAQQHEKSESVRVISTSEIIEKLDAKDSSVTVVEVSLAAGQAGKPHRHPGPVFGYVAEGEYELGIDDLPTRVFKAGETFYEPTGCLHRVSKNASSANKARIIAVLIHPRDAKQIAIPEAGHE